MMNQFVKSLALELDYNHNKNGAYRIVGTLMDGKRKTLTITDSLQVALENMSERAQRLVPDTFEDMKDQQ